MQCLANRLEDGFGIGSDQCCQAGSSRWTQVGDVVNLMLVQTDRFDEVDLNFITGGDTTDQLMAGVLRVLGCGQDGGNVVAGVRVVGGQERVVVGEFPDGHAIGPCGAAWGNLLVNTGYGCSTATGRWSVCGGLCASRDDGRTIQ